MKTCFWCGEVILGDRRFCDDLCERLDRDYKAQSSLKDHGRHGRQNRTKQELKSHKNKVRSG